WPARDRLGNRGNDSEEVSGRGGALFFAETKLVGRRRRGGADRCRGPLDGPGRAETIRSRREGHRAEDCSGDAEEIAPGDESAPVLQRNAERFARARWRLGRSLDRRARCLVRWNGGQSL